MANMTKDIYAKAISIGVEIKYREKLADWQDLKETHEKHVKNAKETVTKQNEQISDMTNEMHSLKERLKADENKVKLNETQIADKAALIEQLKVENADLVNKLDSNRMRFKKLMRPSSDNDSPATKLMRAKIDDRNCMTSP